MSLPADMSLNKYSLEFPVGDLAKATNNFEKSSVLGRGGFGCVYKGVRVDGTEIAIKALDLPKDSGFEEEVRVLSKFRHPNLVILMGFSRQGNKRLLVYEYLEGGDLFQRIHRRVGPGEEFAWRSRVSAAYNAACGLSHLHSSQPKVFHRDIKTPNILLDWAGTAKMADFGLSCSSQTKALHVAKAGGTPGYSCPTYTRTNIVTEGSEAYSFGVVLMELATSSAPSWQKPGGAYQEWNHLTDAIGGNADLIVSMGCAQAKWPPSVLKSVASLAVQCTGPVDHLRLPFLVLVSQLRQLRDAPADVVAQPAAQILHPQAAKAPAGQTDLGPVLWTLRCTAVPGSGDALEVPVCDFDRDRVIVHRQHPERLGGRPPEQTVGRQTQVEFFKRWLLRENVRNMVSREHFRIRTVEPTRALADAAAGGGKSREFILINNSNNELAVNSGIVARGEEVSLDDGDLISLLEVVGSAYRPYMVLQFCTKGSSLSGLPNEVNPRREVVKPCLPMPNSPPSFPYRAEPGAADPVAPMHEDDIEELVYALEAHGSALRADLPIHRRRISHGRTKEEAAGGTLAPLMIGRAYATDFWKDLLRPEAFQHLSREHAVLAVAEVKGDSPARGITVRGLTAYWTVRVCPRAVAATSQEALIIKDRGDDQVRHKGEVPLQEGDAIVLFDQEGCSLWLSYVSYDPPTARG